MGRSRSTIKALRATELAIPRTISIWRCRRLSLAHTLLNRLVADFIAPDSVAPTFPEGNLLADTRINLA